MLAYAPDTVTFKQITEELIQRETFVVEYRFLEKPEAAVLYPPPQHRDFIAELYRNLGVAPRFAVPGLYSGEPGQGKGMLVTKATVFMPKGYAAIEVKQYGKNIVGELRGALRDLCMKNYDVIDLIVDLTDPMTCRLARDLESLGFFFGGILPGGASGKDALMLQYLNNIAIDYDKIQLHSEMGRRTLEYIRQNDPGLLV